MNTCEVTLRLCRGTVPGAPPSPYTRPQQCPKILLKTVLGTRPESTFAPRHVLSGPVSRDTARLSQRYPPSLRAMGFLGVSTWPIGWDTPSPFSERLPLREHAKWRCDTPPPQKGYLSDTCAIPYENKANWCDTTLCDTISKRYCAIWGGISHWAAKGTFEKPPNPLWCSWLPTSIHLATKQQRGGGSRHGRDGVRWSSSTHQSDGQKSGREQSARLKSARLSPLEGSIPLGRHVCRTKLPPKNF